LAHTGELDSEWRSASRIVDNEPCERATHGDAPWIRDAAELAGWFDPVEGIGLACPVTLTG